MYFAILAYHAEDVVESWSKDEDASLMVDLLKVNDRLVGQSNSGRRRVSARPSGRSHCADRAPAWSPTAPSPRRRSTCSASMS